MAYGIKSTTKTELGDILWSDLTGDSVFDSKNMKASDEVFKTMKGDELGEVTDIQSSYYELEGGYYIKKTAKTHPMANKDYNYPDSSSDTKTSSSSSGGFLDYVKTFLGFGTEVLKATNAKNTDSTSNNADNSEDENTDTDKSGAAASNNKTWYFVAGFVIILVILVIIFWKPKSAPVTAQPQQYLEIKPAQQLS